MIIVISAPSGCGKTTAVNYMIELSKGILHHSVSCTTRAPRGSEINGRDYYFIKESEFVSKISAGEFLEYEEVYPGIFYGTLKSELEKGNVILDLDVRGGKNLKSIYGDSCTYIQLYPPTIEDLRKRLEKRGEDAEEVIETRVKKAAEEIEYGSRVLPYPDFSITAIDIEQTKTELRKIYEKIYKETTERN